MKIFEAIKIAFGAVWANKGRAFLTMLGIIIGISSVASLMAIGQGVKADVSKQISSLGSNLIFVFPGKMESNGNSGFGGANAASMMGGNILTQKDLNTIKKIDNVENLTPLMIVPGILKTKEKLSNQAIVAGFEPNALNIIAGYDLGDGRFFTNKDDGKNVIIIGDPIAEELFGSSKKAIGKNVYVGQNTFQVVGTVRVKESGDTFGISGMESLCGIPLQTAVKIVGQLSISRIIIKVKESSDVNSTKEIIKSKILANHGGTEDFSVLTQEDLLNFLDTILKNDDSIN